MSTQKMLREIKRQAALLGVTITVSTSAKAHLKAVATLEDGRTKVFTIACSPKDADNHTEQTLRKLRHFKEGRDG